jgi:hypothetical protein
MLCGKEYHERNKPERLAKNREYAASHKAEKSAYDKSRRDINNGRRNIMRAAESSERRTARLEGKRQSYLRHRDKNLIKMRDYHAQQLTA